MTVQPVACGCDPCLGNMGRKAGEPLLPCLLGETVTGKVKSLNVQFAPGKPTDDGHALAYADQIAYLQHGGSLADAGPVFVSLVHKGAAMDGSDMYTLGVLTELPGNPLTKKKKTDDGAFPKGNVLVQVVPLHCVAAPVAPLDDEPVEEPPAEGQAAVATVTYQSAGSANAKAKEVTYSMDTILLSTRWKTVARGDILPCTPKPRGTKAIDYVFTKADLAASGLPLSVDGE